MHHILQLHDPATPGITSLNVFQFISHASSGFMHSTSWRSVPGSLSWNIVQP